MTIRLTSYLNKIEAKYVKAREEWSRLQQKRVDEEDRYNKIDWSLYSFEGQKKEYTDHLLKRKEISKEFEDLRDSFNEAVEEIKADSDKVFNRAYNYSSGDIDQKGIALLQVGNLSTRDLMSLAEDYRQQGNNTMYFLIASKMGEDKGLSGDKEAFSFYSEAERKKNSRDDHDMIESMRTLCISGLRDEDYLSDGIDKQHESLYSSLREQADGITTETDSPWD